MKITLTVCDVCANKDAETQRFEIRTEDRKVSVELCEAHAQPLLAYLDQETAVPAKAPQKRTQKRTPGRRATRHKVTSMEEIEKLKKK